MDDSEIWSEIVEAVREEIGDPTLSIKSDQTAADVPGWDSVTHVRIMLNVEIRTGAQLEIKNTYRAKTIGDLVPIFKKAIPV